MLLLLAVGVLFLSFCGLILRSVAGAGGAYMGAKQAVFVSLYITVYEISTFLDGMVVYEGVVILPRGKPLMCFGVFSRPSRERLSCTASDGRPVPLGPANCRPVDPKQGRFRG